MSNYASSKVSSVKGKKGNEYLVNNFIRYLDDLVDEQVQNLLDDEVDYLQDRIEELANNELQKYFSYVSACMGLENKPKLRDKGAVDFFTYNVFDRVVWFPLTKRTRELKRKWAGESKRNIKWESFNPKNKSNKLKDYLKGLPFDESCFVTVTPIPRKGPGRPPKAKAYRLSLSVPLDDDTISQEIGDEKQIEKVFGMTVYGSNEERRPIFNPVAEYFMRQRIPRIIRDTIKSEVGRNVEFG